MLLRGYCAALLLFVVVKYEALARKGMLVPTILKQMIVLIRYIPPHVTLVTAN